MRGFRVIMFLGLLFFPIASDAGDLDYARFYQRLYLSGAIMFKSLPGSSVGTGFLTKFDSDPNRFIFTTNKHVVENAVELELTIPIVDSNLTIVGTVQLNVPLFKDTAKQYYIPGENLDIALLILQKSILSRLSNVGFASLRASLYTQTNNLFVGQPIVFSGYTLGLTVNEKQPLLRKGSIAGIDTLKNIIYLDADAYGGSSGSPVFIDFSSNANIEFYNKYNQLLIGIISGYKPFTKQLVNLDTKKVEMIQTENSGIAIVVPAEKIKSFADSLLKMSH